MTHAKSSARNLIVQTGQRAATPVPPAPEDWIAQMRARLDPPGRPAPAPSAAVLAPLVRRDGRLHVILTLRPDTLPSHPGQVCFPGGHIRAGEASAAAALRETHEEIGIPPEQIDLLGRWEPTSTLGGVQIAPFAGLVDPAAAPQPCPREVAAMFDAPLDYLLDRTNWRETTQRGAGGATHRVFAIRYRDYMIWGATAAMLGALGARLAGGAI